MRIANSPAEIITRSKPWSKQSIPPHDFRRRTLRCWRRWEAASDSPRRLRRSFLAEVVPAPCGRSPLLPKNLQSDICGDVEVRVRVGGLGADAET